MWSASISPAFLLALAILPSFSSAQGPYASKGRYGFDDSDPRIVLYGEGWHRNSCNAIDLPSSSETWDCYGNTLTYFEWLTPDHSGDNTSLEVEFEGPNLYIYTINSYYSQNGTIDIAVDSRYIAQGLTNFAKEIRTAPFLWFESTGLGNGVHRLRMVFNDLALFYLDQIRYDGDSLEVGNAKNNKALGIAFGIITTFLLILCIVLFCMLQKTRYRLSKARDQLGGTAADNAGPPLATWINQQLLPGIPTHAPPASDQAAIDAAAERILNRMSQFSGQDISVPQPDTTSLQSTIHRNPVTNTLPAYDGQGPSPSLQQNLPQSFSRQISYDSNSSSRVEIQQSPQSFYPMPVALTPPRPPPKDNEPPSQSSITTPLQSKKSNG